jgi:hypothetical protein
VQEIMRHPLRVPAELFREIRCAHFPFFGVVLDAVAGFPQRSGFRRRIITG